MSRDDPWDLFGESRKLQEGEPCGRLGCLNHVTHPCEGCGRVHGRTPVVKVEVTSEAWGVGKTTISGIIKRALEQHGYNVVLDPVADEFVAKHGHRAEVQNWKQEEVKQVNELANQDLRSKSTPRSRVLLVPHG